MGDAPQSCSVNKFGADSCVPLTCQGSADGGGVQQTPSVAGSSTDSDSVAEAKAQAVQLQLQQQVGGGDLHILPSTLHARSAAFHLTHHQKQGWHLQEACASRIC